MNAAPDEVLLADIGGTNARFARLRDGALHGSARLEVCRHPDPAAAIRAYLEAQEAPPPERAVLAVAGPVEAGTARLTNAAWRFDTEEMARATGIGRVVLVNDFAAQAWALPALADADLIALGGGAPRRGAAKLVLGPGTGLGVAAYLPAGAGQPARVVSGEGGHAALAGADAGEDALLARLRARYGRVSAERALSGPGLVALADAVAAEQGSRSSYETAEAVTRAAPDEPVAAAALARFCALLGSFAGDLALIFGAYGGVYLAGGIPPRIAATLTASEFRARFEAKGRFREAMQRIPAWIVRHPDPAFLGLAQLAARLD